MSGLRNSEDMPLGSNVNMMVLFLIYFLIEIIFSSFFWLSFHF